MNQEFENKIGIITGAVSGIGWATAQLLSQNGATVLLLDINDEKGKEAVATIHQQGGKAVYFHCNVALQESIDTVMNQIQNDYGKIDFAVNAAGITGNVSSKTHEYPVDQWQQQLNINLFGTWYSMKKELQLLLANKGGSIVNLASIGGLKALPMNSPYAASKFGVVGITQTAALEYANQNIRINAVCPSAIETPMTLYGRRKLAENPEAYEATKHIQAMERMGSAEEVAEVIYWLTSEKSSFITGIAMPVDGGALLK